MTAEGDGFLRFRRSLRRNVESPCLHHDVACVIRRASWSVEIPAVP
jgi:hypothetical protein